MHFPCLSKCYTQESGENREHSLSAVFGQISISFVFLFCSFVVFSSCYCPELNHVRSFLFVYFLQKCKQQHSSMEKYSKAKGNGLFIGRIKPMSTCCFRKGKICVHDSFQSVESSSFLSTVSGRFNNIYAVNSLKACWSCSAKPSSIFWPHANF